MASGRRAWPRSAMAAMRVDFLVSSPPPRLAPGPGAAPFRPDRTSELFRSTRPNLPCRTLVSTRKLAVWSPGRLQAAGLSLIGQIHHEPQSLLAPDLGQRVKQRMNHVVAVQIRAARRWPRPPRARRAAWNGWDRPYEAAPFASWSPAGRPSAPSRWLPARWPATRIAPPVTGHALLGGLDHLKLYCRSPAV